MKSFRKKMKYALILAFINFVVPGVVFSKANQPPRPPKVVSIQQVTEAKWYRNSATQETVLKSFRMISPGTINDSGDPAATVTLSQFSLEVCASVGGLLCSRLNVKPSILNRGIGATYSSDKVQVEVSFDAGAGQFVPPPVTVPGNLLVIAGVDGGSSLKVVLSGMYASAYEFKMTAREVAAANSMPMASPSGTLSPR